MKKIVIVIIIILIIILGVVILYSSISKNIKNEFSKSVIPVNSYTTDRIYLNDLNLTGTLGFERLTPTIGSIPKLLNLDYFCSDNNGLVYILKDVELNKQIVDVYVKYDVNYKTYVGKDVSIIGTVYNRQVDLLKNKIENSDYNPDYVKYTTMAASQSIPCMYLEIIDLNEQN